MILFYKKYWEFFPNLFVKTNNFQLVFHFEKTRTTRIWRAWYDVSYTMMAAWANQSSRVALSNDSVFNKLYFNYISISHIKLMSLCRIHLLLLHAIAED